MHKPMYGCVCGCVWSVRVRVKQIFMGHLWGAAYTPNGIYGRAARELIIRSLLRILKYLHILRSFILFIFCCQEHMSGLQFVLFWLTLRVKN